MWRLSCWLGRHCTFIQEDKWGMVMLCRHCNKVLREMKA